MNNEWTKEFELSYWIAREPSFYLENIRNKCKLFNVSKYITSADPICAVDIGGGAYGGALSYLFSERNSLILVDALAKEFREMQTLPTYIDSITADFANIPLKNNIADIIFACNVYDHANSSKHFYKGIFEAARLLKPKGLFFLSVPMRKVATKGHPVCIKEFDINLAVKGLFDVVKVFEEMSGKILVKYMVLQGR